MWTWTSASPAASAPRNAPKRWMTPYNVGISKRKAIYLQYSQTVPLKYAIDDENCLYFTKGKCQACDKFCPTGAINFDDKGETRTLQVGSVILAPGYQAFDPTGLSTLRLRPHSRCGHRPGVRAAALRQRSLHGPPGAALGPQGAQKGSPGCSASAPATPPPTANSYCSTVCCMYAVKQCLVTAEHTERR